MPDWIIYYWYDICFYSLCIVYICILAQKQCINSTELIDIADCLQSLSAAQSHDVTRIKGIVAAAALEAIRILQQTQIDIDKIQSKIAHYVVFDLKICHFDPSQECGIAENADD